MWIKLSDWDGTGEVRVLDGSKIVRYWKEGQRYVMECESGPLHYGSFETLVCWVR